MDVAEFDRFADEYREMLRSVTGVTGEAPEFFAEYKIREVSRFAGERNVQPRNILDFGSGTGSSIPHFHRFFPEATLTCTDLSQRSLDVAEERFPGMSRSALMEGNRIPAPDDAFDLTFTACVFHHIPHEEHPHRLSELRRVTRTGEMLTIFEHNPLNPLTTRAVSQCPFDENARLIRAKDMVKRFQNSGWRNVRVRYHLFFPHALAGLRGLEPQMAAIPLGAQYSVTATR